MIADAPLFNEVIEIIRQVTQHQIKLLSRKVLGKEENTTWLRNVTVGKATGPLIPIAVDIRRAWVVRQKSKRDTFFDCISHCFGKQRDVHFFHMFF